LLSLLFLIPVCVLIGALIISWVVNSNNKKYVVDSDGINHV